MEEAIGDVPAAFKPTVVIDMRRTGRPDVDEMEDGWVWRAGVGAVVGGVPWRSEERRVGKECPV